MRLDFCTLNTNGFKLKALATFVIPAWFKNWRSDTEYHYCGPWYFSQGLIFFSCELYGCNISIKITTNCGMADKLGIYVKTVW